jgi:hypothetical protein
MSFSADVQALDQSLRRTHTALQTLLRGLQARRAAWVSARPSTLAPSPELEQLTQEVAREESLRGELLARMRAVLPAIPGHDPGQAHVNVTRIAAALPAREAKALRDVADAVQALAKAVRAEVTLGQRLIRFAQGARPDVGRANVRGVVPGYDRGARLRRGAAAAGALVDGKV